MNNSSLSANQLLIIHNNKQKALEKLRQSRLRHIQLHSTTTTTNEQGDKTSHQTDNHVSPSPIQHSHIASPTTISSSLTPWTIYVLVCENSKFYIGKSKQVNIRILEHFGAINHSGSAWTSKYKPIGIVDIIPNCDSFDEDLWTKKYMSQYGISNVRGGSYCQIHLSQDQLRALDREIASCTDKCYICGNANHIMAHCPQKQHPDNNIPTFHSHLRYNPSNQQSSTAPVHHMPSNPSKKRKNPQSSVIPNVRFSRQRCDNYDYDDDDSDDITEDEDDDEEYDSDCCFRCGRMNHFANNCYATMHVRGYPI